MSKEILLNPSVPVGRIDGGRPLYAPRRCRMTEAVREYSYRTLLEQACGTDTILSLVCSAFEKFLPFSREIPPFFGKFLPPFVRNFLEKGNFLKK
jgi:hypothetical protein